MKNGRDIERERAGGRRAAAGERKRERNERRRGGKANLSSFFFFHFLFVNVLLLQKRPAPHQLERERERLVLFFGIENVLFFLSTHEVRGKQEKKKTKKKETGFIWWEHYLKWTNLISGSLSVDGCMDGWMYGRIGKEKEGIGGGHRGKGEEGGAWRWQKSVWEGKRFFFVEPHPHALLGPPAPPPPSRPRRPLLWANKKKRFV